MYRKYPKKQDHGTRGTRHNGWDWEKYYKRCLKNFYVDEKKNFENSCKGLFKKVSIDISDEEIEELLIKTTYIPSSAPWYWFY